MVPYGDTALFIHLPFLDNSNFLLSVKNGQSNDKFNFIKAITMNQRDLMAFQ
jgi:hypothetical protein